MKAITLIILLAVNIQTPKLHLGVVKFYNEKSSFGHIIDYKTKNVLSTDSGYIIDEIKQGDIVIYEIIDTRKGLKAKNVRLWKKQQKNTKTQ